ncbi:MAG: MotA/TolQ/ExbB proton channel family protein [Anaerovoracaceae bacterium]|jgi:biopolymer transport protein ExbB/TolQ
MLDQGDFTNVLRTICSALQTPVIIVLIALIIIVVILTGSLIAELFTDHRHLKVHMPELADRMREGSVPLADCIRQGGLLKRQREALLELTRHDSLTNTMREALAVRLLSCEQSRYDGIVKISDMIARLGPMFGLMGTLIPLGPGIIALGQGDVKTLSDSLLIAFDTTVAGLISAAVAMVISAIRKRWYKNYMSILEASMECVLEVKKDA